MPSLWSYWVTVIEIQLLEGGFDFKLLCWFPHTVYLPPLQARFPVFSYNLLLLQRFHGVSGVCLAQC